MPFIQHCNFSHGSGCNKSGIFDGLRHQVKFQNGFGVYFKQTGKRTGEDLRLKSILAQKEET